MIRDANAGCFPFGQHYPGNQFRTIQYKCIGPWKKSFHGSVGVVGNLGIKADMFQIGTNETEGFVFMALFDLINAFNRLFIHDITTNPIERIGWVGNDAPFFQMFGDTSNKSFLGIYRIDLEQHDLPFGSGDRSQNPGSVF